MAITSKSAIKNSDGKKVLRFLLFPLNASVTFLLPATSSHSLADLFLMCLEKNLSFKIFFGLLWVFFQSLRYLPEFMLLLLDRSRKL